MVLFLKLLVQAPHGFAGRHSPNTHRHEEACVFDPQRKLSNVQDHRRTGTMVGCVCSLRPFLH